MSGLEEGLKLHTGHAAESCSCAQMKRTVLPQVDQKQVSQLAPAKQPVLEQPNGPLCKLEEAAMQCFLGQL